MDIEQVLFQPSFHDEDPTRKHGKCPAILSSEYLVYTDFIPFLREKEYPCEITAINSKELR